MSFSYSLDFQMLASNYKAGMLTPTAVVAEVFSRIQGPAEKAINALADPGGGVDRTEQGPEQQVVVGKKHE